MFCGIAPPLNASVRGQLVVALPTRRTVLIGVVAAAVYYALLYVITPLLPFTTFPKWWRGLWPTPTSGLVSWYGVLSLVAAVLSALPVAAFLLWAIGRSGLRLSLAVGFLVAVYILCSGMVQYGSTAPVLVSGVIQFVVTSFAVAAMMMLATSCPLTTRSSGR